MPPRLSRPLRRLLRPSLDEASPSRALQRTPHRLGRHCDIPLLPSLLALALLLAALLACAGCGGGSSSRVALLRACPGVVGGVCPYTRVRFVGRRGAGVLRCPEALAFAPDGELFVADQFSHVVQRFSPSGRFLGQWGSFGSGPGQFGAVDGLAVDAAGDVFVLDSTHARVERFTASGRLLGEWGRPGRSLGEFDFGPGFGPDKPPGGGLAVGGGFVYVSDSAASRIVRFRLDGSDPVLWGRPGSAPGRFSSPRGLAVVGGVVYVADEGNHRVQALSLAGRPLYAEGSFGTGPGQFVNPFGVAVHGGRVYVVDDNNNRLVVLTRDLRFVEEWSGVGRFHLSYIRASAVDPAGRVFVADTGHERGVAFDPFGRGLFAFGFPGTAPGQFVAPLGVAADDAGGSLRGRDLRQPQPHLPLRLLPALSLRVAAGRGRHHRQPLVRPDCRRRRTPDGSVWVTDPRNGLVRHLSSGGAFLGALGVPAAPGSPTASAVAGAYASGNGGGSATADGERGASGGVGGADALLEPLGVALSPSGAVVYVADTGAGRVVRFTSSGAPLGVFGSVAFERPVALAVGPGWGGVCRRRYACAASSRSRPAGGAARPHWGGAGSAPGRFSREPAGLAVDSAGHVFVSDRAAARVQEFSASGRLLAAWGAPGGGPGELSAPSGLAVDCRGDVLVADTANNRVALFAGAAARGVCAPASAASSGA